MDGKQVEALRGRVCLFVSSSDRTRDIFETVFANFAFRWPNCPLRRFVGVTNAGSQAFINDFELVAAGEDKGWRAELLREIEQLPREMTHLILLLDDFFLQRPVDQGQLLDLCRQALDDELPYVRLRPVERSVWVDALRRMRDWFVAQPLERLNRSEPYYSSLQAAIWSRSHLAAALRQPGNIWEFEHWVPPGGEHYAVRRRALFYRHVVEKGSWRAYAQSLLKSGGSAFRAGAHPVRPASDRFRFYWERAKFGLFGYAGPKLKRKVQHWRRTLAGVVQKRNVHL